VVVVGGGNSAGQAAMHFCRYARKVDIVIRGESLKYTLSQYLVDRINAAKNIDVLTHTELTSCLMLIRLFQQDPIDCG
jgi:thioredoxin reductase (NADPH)